MGISTLTVLTLVVATLVAILPLYHAAGHPGYRHPILPMFVDKRRPVVHRPSTDPPHQGLLLEWLETMPNNLLNVKSRLKLSSAFEDARSSQDVLQTLMAAGRRPQQSSPANTIYKNALSKPYHPSIRFHYRGNHDDRV